LNAGYRPTDALGLPPNVVCLRDHSSAWRKFYNDEALELKKTLGHRLLEVQHVGSTSIAQLKAKPIIDILAGVGSLSDARYFVKPLATLGYDYLGDSLVHEHHVFAKDPQLLRFLLHVVELGGNAWKRVITFRDILRKNPIVAEQYEDLKVLLSRQFGDDRDAYAEAKTTFIDASIANAGSL
jgi:GrpB-like predicted nucleotidyltransferase (UPF0157 family)